MSRNFHFSSPLSPPITPPMSMSHPKDYDNISHQQYLVSGASAQAPRYATVDQFVPRVPQLGVGMHRDEASQMSLSSVNLGAIYHTSSDCQRPNSLPTFSTSAPDDQQGGYTRSDTFHGPSSAVSVEASHARPTYSPPMSPKAMTVKTEATENEPDEDLEEGDDEDEEDSAEPKALTVEEIRRAKRKMKRFRLTHQQTRYLMSEFARQAHPDAAHRERLAREIPGLSPRQVQVWFQNRRAKLKRLTIDDRERMMSSRALPENFDLTQTLHSPFGSNTPRLPGNSPLLHKRANSIPEGSLHHRPGSFNSIHPMLPGSQVTSSVNRHSLGPYPGPPSHPMPSMLSPITPASDGHFGFSAGHGSGHRVNEAPPISPPMSLNTQLQSPSVSKASFGGSYSTLAPSSYRNEIASMMIGALAGNESVLQGFNPSATQSFASHQSTGPIYQQQGYTYPAYSAPYNSHVRSDPTHMHQSISTGEAPTLSSRTSSMVTSAAVEPQSIAVTLPDYQLLMGRDLSSPWQHENP